MSVLRSALRNYFLCRIRLHADHAILHAKLIDGYAETRRSAREERFAGSRARQRKIALVEIRWMRLGTGRCSLIRSKGRIALYEFHAFERHAQFFRDQLRLRRVEPVAELALACVGSHVAVSADGDRKSTRLNSSHVEISY